MIDAMVAAGDVVIRYGHGEIALTGWGGFWLLVFLVAVMR